MVAQKPHSTNQDIFCSELLWLNWDITISNQSYLSAKEFVRCIDSGLSRLVYVYGFCCGLPRAYSSELGLLEQCKYTLVHTSLPFVQEPMNKRNVTEPLFNLQTSELLVCKGVCTVHWFWLITIGLCLWFLLWLA